MVPSLTEGINSMKNHTRTISGRRWQAVINGKRSLNGAGYNMTYQGVTKAGKGITAYDIFKSLAQGLHDANSEMEHIESMQVTIYPPG